MRSGLKLLATFILPLISAALSSVSCDDLGFRDLCYDHSHVVPVDVRFDWTGCPDAHPEKMSVWFYSLDNPSKEPERYDILSCVGGTVRIRFGSYRVLCLNSDTDAILYDGTEKWEDFRIHTRQINDTLILEPNRVWASSMEKVTFGMRQTDARIVFPMSPRNLNVEIEMQNVPNLKYTAQFSATLSGMSSSVGLVSANQDDKRMAIPFELVKISDSTLVASFETFGHCPGMYNPDSGIHNLTVNAVLADGKFWTYSMDITDKVHDPAAMTDDSHLRIVIEGGMPVPKPIVNGGGFKPGIDEWDSEEIDIDI